jgi:hypothetical protein
MEKELKNIQEAFDEAIYKLSEDEDFLEKNPIYFELVDIADAYEKFLEQIGK